MSKELPIFIVTISIYYTFVYLTLVYYDRKRSILMATINKDDVFKTFIELSVQRSASRTAEELFARIVASRRGIEQATRSKNMAFAMSSAIDLLEASFGYVGKITKALPADSVEKILTEVKLEPDGRDCADLAQAFSLYDAEVGLLAQARFRTLQGNQTALSELENYLPELRSAVRISRISMVIVHHVGGEMTQVGSYLKDHDSKDAAR